MHLESQHEVPDGGRDPAARALDHRVHGIHRRIALLPVVAVQLRLECVPQLWVAQSTTDERKV